MRIRLLPFVCIILGVFFLASAVEAQQYFHDGNDLVKLMKEYEKAEAKDPNANYMEVRHYGAYILGVHDATTVLYGDKGKISIQQILGIVAKYLKAHPEKLDGPASDLVIDALKEAFPKKP